MILRMIVDNMEVDVHLRMDKPFPENEMKFNFTLSCKEKAGEAIKFDDPLVKRLHEVINSEKIVQI